jgi:hypothetical protein
VSCLLLLFEAINLFHWISINTGGALKPTDIDGLWVHVTCAWFQPKVSFPVDETMEPAMGIMSIPVEYFKKVEIFYWYFHNLHPKFYLLWFPFKFQLIFAFSPINCRLASYASKCMVPAHNATNALPITTQYVRQELDIAWRLNAAHFAVFFWWKLKKCLCFPDSLIYSA